MKRKGIIHSILLRYMISYTAVMALLFVAVGLYMSNTYAASIRENTVESSINKLGIIRYRHEENLATLLSVGKQIGLSPYITSFQLLKEPMLAYHLKLQLVPYTMTLDFCDQLYLIFNEDDYLYSSATSVGLNMFLYKLMHLENTPPEALLNALRRRDNGVTIFPAQNVSSILADGNNRMVAVVAPVSMGERYNTGNVLFLIKESAYQRMFADEIYEPRNTYIFYGDSVLAASRNLGVADEAVLRETKGIKGTLVKNLHLDGRQYLLVAKQGSMFGMLYATLLPMETIRAGMARAQWGFGLFLFALAIPCMALTFYLSKRHVKPIKELRYLFSATPGKDDFEAVKSGIEALVDKNEALSTRLTESLPMRRADFIKDFVKGRYVKREDAVKAAAELSLHIDKKCFAVALIGAPPRDGAEVDLSRIADSLQGDVSGYCVELLALEQFLFVLFSDSQEAIEGWACAAQSQAARADAGVAVALSAVHQQFHHVGSAYLEALTAYDNRFVMGSARVLRFCDVGAAAKDIAPFTRSYLDSFRKALRAGDARALNDRMDELFHYLTSTQMSLFAFRMIYNSVIGAILSEHLDRTRGSMDALKFYDVFTLSGCRSIADLDDLLRKLCRDILSKGGAQNDQNPPVIRGIIAYMHNHFAEPGLSMSAIADAYQLSAVRLSLDFKELTGMSPSEYLLLLRMEKAKELLCGTDMPVKDIGAAVGYVDASGFIRRFRQHMAMTPAQYRQRLAGNEQKLAE